SGGDETMGLTAVRCLAVKTTFRNCSGILICLSRAWATGLRTNATSRMPGMRKSPTYCPRPRRKRSSSLRGTEAPIPDFALGNCFSPQSAHDILKLFFDRYQYSELGSQMPRRGVDEPILAREQSAELPKRPTERRRCPV